MAIALYETEVIVGNIGSSKGSKHAAVGSGMASRASTRWRHHGKILKSNSSPTQEISRIKQRARC